MPAHSRSPATEVRPGAAGWSRSMRYRNFGETRTASQRGGDSLLKGIALLPRQGDVSRYSSTSPGGRPDGGKRALRSSSKSSARTHRCACPRACPQTKILRRLSGDGPVAWLNGPPISIDSNRLSTRVSTPSVLILVPYLRSVSMSFSVSLAARSDQRLGRPLRRLGAVIAGRQPVVVSQVGFREQVFARGDPRAAFDDLAFQIGGIDLELLHQLAIDKQRGMRRLRLVGPVPVEHQAEAVLGIDRKAVDEVRGMARAQARLVVVEQVLGQRGACRANR